MASQLARQKAAGAWGRTPETLNKVMDPDLAEAFAEIIDEIIDKPWLGNATTRQLIEEIKVRCEMDGTLDYRTVDGDL